MKKTFATITLIITTGFGLFAQDQKVFQINYQSIMNDSAGSAEEGNITISVNKEVFRLTNGGNTQVEIYDKKNLSSYLLDPEEKNYYLLYTDNEGEINYESIPLTYITGEEKTIAGYRCKLAEISVPTEMAESEGFESIKIWYSEELPKIYWSQFNYLQVLPGAPLSVTYGGSGFEAKSVETKILSNNLFSLPTDYTLQEVEEDNEVIEETADDAVEASLEAEMAADSAAEDNYAEEDLMIAEDRFTYRDSETELKGIKDENGNNLTQAIYTEIGFFNGGIAIVINSKGQYGSINTMGKTIIPCTYEFINYDELSQQYIFATKETYGLLNSDGSIYIPSKYSSLSFQVNGLIEFLADGKWGLMDGSEKVVVPASYENIFQRNNTHFIASVADKYQLHNLKTNQAIGQTYSFMVLPSEGETFLVYENEKYGYMNEQGKITIPMKFSYATPFSNGIAMVAEDETLENTYYINTKGLKVADPAE